MTCGKSSIPASSRSRLSEINHSNFSLNFHPINDPQQPESSSCRPVRARRFLAMSKHLTPLRVLVIFFLLYVFWTIAALRSGGPRPKETPEPSSDPAPARPKPKFSGCGPDSPEFTAADVKAHKLCNFGRGDFDVWMVIEGKVYDVTEWAPRHPGGQMLCQVRQRSIFDLKNRLALYNYIRNL